MAKLQIGLAWDIILGRYLSSEYFEQNWITHKDGHRGVSGYKYHDCPGCYAIFVFDDVNHDEDFSNYSYVYIGQSVHICKRVHDHFRGKGNGDIYADIRSGRKVYVKMYPCAPSEMNDIEKQLISIYNATASYNKTKGGGQKRG